ncbi:MAG: 50S ribosomal protein L10 [Bacteroidales bacterium]|jgi:large subunit ribosomal protein L10|nr:50S ribosomal protein L10 [Bacteroidales bacterium]
MRKEEKSQVIESISAQLQETPNFYITDISGLNAENTSKLRKACFEKGITLTVVKNTLMLKALDQIANDEMKKVYEALVGPTAIMYCNAPLNAPAKLIKKFNDEGLDKPVLKAAYLEESGAYVGADQLGALCAIKSREELIGDIVAMLQQAGGQKIAGILKTMEEKKSEE